MYSYREENSNCILNIDGFLDSVNHDVRSSINSMMDAIDLILMDNINTAQKQNLNLIKSNTRNLLNLLNKTIDFFKIQFFNINIENITFDFKDFVNDIIKLSDKEISDNDIKFKTYVDQNIPGQLIGDVYRLKQIVRSIIVNVIKFSKHGIISFTVEIISSNQKQINLRFKIKSTSIYLCENDIYNLCRKFSNSNSIIETYIVKEIIELMGGRIQIIDGDKIGTSFQFDLTFEVGKESHLVDSGNENLCKVGNDSKFALKNSDIYEDIFFLTPL
ncbi:hypothetical protein D4Z93_12870 [Clostridium fermenticellae]|uniref:histidine kinase n=1 Tax=Clostridium fermenticellae TaxID=2068654 RepID=A0A386H721_9CLOT|nr:HAMP domain-containing sensor histidine kinase [Clostridium fermenticellae]AYD41340.1 hypothetical protein D4Z93_12870 [Clostridium fermenticellae]